MDQQLTRLSKFISLVLRHQPEKIGLTLDREGWADVSALIAAAQRAGVPLTHERLLAVVAQNDKQRFALSADGTRIRARQGHSIAVDLGLTPQEPPPLLYHGTATRFLAAIRAQGLQPRSRQYVHLSADQATAARVGARHGVPVVLRIRAAALYQSGAAFYQAENGVWLTAEVPPGYLDLPPDVR